MLNEAQQALASRYVPLANSIARRFSANRPRSRDEIKSAAYLGLTLAAESFNAQEDVTFFTYARQVITNTIRRELRDSRPRGYQQSRDREHAPKTLTMSPGVERHAVRPPGDVPFDRLEAQEAFERLLERFRPGHRPFLRLLFVEDLSISEASAELGLTRAEALRLYSQALAGFGTKVRPDRPRLLVADRPLSA
jgi:RNA polymerase sigma factor (sigma-70 family)